MTGALVIDASVAVKWFIPEADTAAAYALRDMGADIIGPDILATETSSAISRAHRTGRLDRAGAEAAFAAANAYFTGRGIVLAPSRTVLARAQAISLDLRHALVDCLYVALAEREAAPLITADATFITRAAPHFSFVKAL